MKQFDLFGQLAERSKNVKVKRNRLIFKGADVKTKEMLKTFENQTKPSGDGEKAFKQPLELIYFIKDLLKVLEKTDKGQSFLSLLQDTSFIESLNTDKLKKHFTELSIVSTLLTERSESGYTWISRETFSSIRNNRAKYEILKSLYSAYYLNELEIKDTLRIENPKEVVTIAIGAGVGSIIDKKVNTGEVDKTKKNDQRSIENTSNKVEHLMNLIDNIYPKLAVIDESARILKKRREDNGGATPIDYLNYYENVFGLVDGFVIDMEDSLGNKIKNDYYPLIKNSYMAGKVKNYSIIGFNSIKMLTLLHKDLYDTKSLVLDDDFMKKTNNYINLIASIAQAKTSEDITAIIESVALPPGSYTAKRISKFDISVNAYVGLLYGREEEANNDGAQGYRGNLGFTAPIGLSFSWGARMKEIEVNNLGESNRKRAIKALPKFKDGNTYYYRTGNSNTVFVTIFDLGAPVLYRLGKGKDGEAFPTDVKFSQLVSPGLSYIRGLRNSAFSMYTGIQYTPGLRKLEGESDRASVFRFNVGVLIDIPLFNVVNY